MTNELQIIVAAVAGVLSLILAGFKLRRRVRWNKTKTGAKLYWESKPIFVNWSKHLQAKHQEMIFNAINVWNYGLNKTIFVKGMPTELNSSIAMNGIYFMYDPIDDDNTYGTAEVFKNEETGVIDYAIIKLDPPSDAALDSQKLPGTCQHELGHSLGMGHSDYPTDLMYKRNEEGRAELGEHEIEAFNEVYGL